MSKHNELWGVWCRVSGGVTGTREAWLKERTSPEGAKYECRTAVFATKAEAQAKARNLMANLSPYRTADFSYTARPMEF